MKREEKDKKFSKFLDFIYEPYNQSKISINRALHFSKFYTLVCVTLEVIVLFVLLFVLIFNPEAANTILKPTYIIIIVLAFLLINAMVSYFRFEKIDNVSHRTNVDVARVLGSDVQKSYEFGKLGMIIVDEKDNIIWINDYLYSRQIKIMDDNIFNSFPELKDISATNNVHLKINNVNYEVHYFEDSHLYIFKDINAYVEEHENAVNESLVIGRLVIDTYEELERTIDVKKFNQLILNTVNHLDEYFNKFNVLPLDTGSEDTLILLCNKASFDRMLADKFSFIDDIRNNTKSTDHISLTISVGFGYGFNESIMSLYERASSACSTALKRGGDQIIVSYLDKQDVYGGHMKVQRQQDLVKYRTYAQQLSALIRDSSKVIITGHKVSDIDSIGATLGMYGFATNVKRNDKSTVPTYMVFDPNSAQINALQLYQNYKKLDYFKGAFVTPSELNSMIDEKTLLIVVDVHNPVSTLVSQYLDITNSSNNFTRVVIFDHHMKNTSDIDIDPLLEFIDPSISSASEMITHLLEYSEEKVRMPHEIPDAMLSGIMLDTSFFKTRVDNSTFYACNLLIQRGANQNTAANILKEAYETYQLKCTLSSSIASPDSVDNFYLRNGLHIFIICALDPKNPNVLMEKDILAKVASEHVATKDVDACFVIGKTGDDEFYVSSRGNGKFNVQRICESFEDGYGGGEFDRAAVLFQTKDETLFDIKDKVKEKILELSDDQD